MAEERYTAEAWQRMVKPIDWEQSYRTGAWGHLGNLDEAPRHALIGGYLHHLLGTGKVLDAGCGEGVLVEYLDRGRLHFSGFDLSPTAIERARERYPDCDLVSCSIEDFQPPPGVSYDAVVFSDSLASLTDPIGALDRYLGFLSDRGYLIVSQYQPTLADSNGARFARVLENEIAAGRYSLVTCAEVVSLAVDRRWRVFCLTPPRPGQVTGE